MPLEWVVLSVAAAVAAAGRARNVLTTQGVVRGYLATHPPRRYEYLGVPYATAKRFKAPRPVRRWDGTFEATYQVKCPQPDGSGTEDCLVVNVFSPEHAAELPVVVIMHDGGFQSGWGPFQPPTRLLAQDFVVVTFNYRLGALGFLCLGTREAPGNAGLKDQVAALYWVQKNIGNFGGNPLDVSVYGIGSGASSVQVILLSGVAKGLFHKAILESGSALSPLSLAYDPLQNSFEAAVAMGYNGEENVQDLVKFYRELPVHKFTDTKTLFLPCIEKNLEETHSLLDSDPMIIFQQCDYQKIPMLIAYTNTLGANTIEKDLANVSVPETFENLLPNNLQFENDDMKRKVAEIVKEFYFGKILEKNAVQNYIDYFIDVTFEYPIIKSAVLHAATSSSPVFLMRYSGRSTLANGIKKDNFNQNLLYYFYERDDMQYHVQAQQVMTLWSNFIRIGDPTPLTTSLVPMVWQPVKAYMENSFNIKSVTGLIFGTHLRLSDEMAHERMLFWDQVYKKFYRSHSVLLEDDEIN